MLAKRYFNVNFFSVDSSAQFRLKSEREWEDRQNQFTSEFFSLDLKLLESSISCVPLNTVLNMEDHEFDVSYNLPLPHRLVLNKLSVFVTNTVFIYRSNWNGSI